MKKTNKNKGRPQKKFFQNEPKRTSEGEVLGSLKMHYEGYGFVIPEKEGETDVFVPARNMNGALPEDKVVVSVTGGDGKRREGTISQIVDRGRKLWIGKLLHVNHKTTVLNQDFVADYEIEIPFMDSALSARDGDSVVVRITQYPQNSSQKLKGEITKVLGRSGEHDTVVKSVLAQHGIEEEFPAAVEKDAQDRAKTPYHNQKGRKDLTGLPFITIDGITAKDFDDAVCIEKSKLGYVLYVAIADVSHYVVSGSPLDEEAIRRGTSVYFPDFAVPMLPELLSNDLLSLKPEVDRPVLVCEMHIKEDGKFAKASYYTAVIHSQKRAIYEEIQAAVDGKPLDANPQVKESVHVMVELAEVLRKRRQARGAIDLDLPEAEFVFGPTGKIIDIVKRERLFSHLLIEEFMIAANSMVAALFDAIKIPIPNRAHDEPSEDKKAALTQFLSHIGMKAGALKEPRDFNDLLKKVKNHPMRDLINQLVLRSMAVAAYSPQNIGHFGLALADYCHFTSPIRRYPDLIVHRQLKTLLSLIPAGIVTFDTSKEPGVGKAVLSKIKENHKVFYNFEKLTALCRQSSKRERDAMEAERDMHDYFRTRFAKSHVGETVPGVIKRITKFGFFVELQPYFLDVLVHISDLKGYFRFDEDHYELKGRGDQRDQSYQVGDPVIIKLLSVDMNRFQIRAVLPERKQEKGQSKNEGKKKGRRIR